MTASTNSQNTFTNSCVRSDIEGASLLGRYVGSSDLSLDYRISRHMKLMSFVTVPTKSLAPYAQKRFLVSSQEVEEEFYKLGG